MKAAIIRDYETAVEIAEIDKPELQDDSVIIEVHAASLNPIDNILRAGYLRQMLVRIPVKVISHSGAK